MTSARIKWEYKLVNLCNYFGEEIIKELNKLGKLGWEISCAPTPNDIIFKRKLK